MEFVGWDSVIVAALALISSYLTIREAKKSKERTASIQARQLEMQKDKEKAARSLEQQKVDADAYGRAQEILTKSIKRLETDVQRLEEGLQLARAEVIQVREERDKERTLNSAYRRRVRQLEAALKDSGIPIPKEDMAW